MRPTTALKGSPASASGPRGRWWRSPGIRPRILAWYVVLLSIATVITIMLERNVLLNSLDQRVDTELMQEVDEFNRLLGGRAPDGSCNAARLADGSCEVGRNPETGEPFGDDVAAAFDTFLRRSIPGQHETMVTFVDGDHYASSIDTSPVVLEADPDFVGRVRDVSAPTRGDVDTAAGPVRFRAVPVGSPDAPAVFAVAQFMEPQLAQVREGVQVAAIANLVVLGIASFLAYLAAGRLLRPVRLVTEAATAISETDLSRRIPVEGDDEVSHLASTFNAMLDRLEDAFAAQRQFFDDAGHELRTPITIIRGNLELLPDESQARDRSIAIATAELDRMARMVQDLLTLAKAERPDFLSVGPVDIETLLLDAYDKARTLGAREWVVDIRGCGVMEGDEQRLTQAVMQLAENAKTHTDPGDRITIGCDASDRQIRIWVDDTGSGIPDRDQQRIFERFHRGSEPRGEGTGLGLAIVTAIARAHGGRIELVSEPGEGSRFTLHLPASFLNSVPSPPAEVVPS
jgi:two-component system, OmpR family, sensor kinase